MRKYAEEDWECLADTPKDFELAIKNACSESEREFFEKLRHKVLYETAASNDVLMNEQDNDDGLFILRVGTDDIMIGKNLSAAEEKTVPSEFAGIFSALEQDLFEYVGVHITLLQWLRQRDYQGIRYDANNDLN